MILLLLGEERNLVVKTDRWSEEDKKWSQRDLDLALMVLLYCSTAARGCSG